MPETKHPASGLRRHGDLAAVALILVLTLFSARNVILGDTPVGMDAATQFYPWYTYLGESLRSGQIPAWNPHQFSGVPFAGDPLSGWTYLPAMLLFTLLPLTAAAKTYILLHLLLAGLYAYALARALGMGLAGSLLSGVAYEYASYLYVRNTCCFAYASVYAWLPLAILGAELAIKSARWRDRGLWWGVSGLAVSQILASWLGQGSYYALLALGGYVAYRTLLVPPEGLRSVRKRISGAALHGAAVLLFGFGLAAAGLLPRLEYNALSNLAGGYSLTGVAGGWTTADWDRLLVPPTLFYAGTGVLVLALAAAFLSRRWTLYAVPYSAGLALFALVFAGKGTATPLHSVLYLLPYLERLHPHNPQRVMVIFYLGAALLAGAALTHLIRGESRRLLALSLPVLALVLLATRSTLKLFETPRARPNTDLWSAPVDYLLRPLAEMPPVAFWSLVLVAFLAAACALLPTRFALLRSLAAGLVVLVVFFDLHTAGQARLEVAGNLRGGDKIVEMDLEGYYAPTDATRFLQSREGVSRYAGYEPRFTPDGRVVPYHIRFTDPETRALEAENRATFWGGNMYSIQGYNALQLARYAEYMRALNGRTQDYHDADVFPGGLDSPLLDLLGARYILVPAAIDAETPQSVRELASRLPTVYRDDTVRVLENREALPHAWIVHSARQATRKEARELLASGAVDPRETALLERPPPGLGKPADPSGDRVSVEGYEANEMRVEVETETEGLLLLADVYYPAWKAYVDGERAPLYRANHLFRAVPIPAGEHTVELRYESRPLRMGLAISAATGLVLVALIPTRIRGRDSSKSDAAHRKEHSNDASP